MALETEIRPPLGAGGMGEVQRAHDTRLRGSIPLRKASDYAVQIVHSLAAAHEKGIVHRDLKPEDLFVTKDGRVRILDFGPPKLGSAPTGSPRARPCSG